MKGETTMKTNRSIMVLAAAALAPALAVAGTDEVAASFERDLQRSLVKEAPVTVAKAWADPLDIINLTLNREPDAILASFDRSFYHKPFNTEVPASREADPLDVIDIAVRNTEPNPILASFQYSLYREGVHAANLPVTYDDPLRAINVALWDEMGDRRTVHMMASVRY
jgi:hypothetical protein